MAALIPSKDILKLHFPEIEDSFDASTFVPTGVKIENEYLRKIIGQTLLDTLRAGSLSADKTLLLNKCRDVIAPLIIYKSTPKLSNRIGDAGINSTTSESFEASQKWKVYDLKNTCLIDGYTAIQELYLFLTTETTQDWYATWKASSAYTSYKELLLNDVNILQENVNINGSYWLFSNMKPAINMVQKQYVASAIGREFLDALIVKFKADTLTTEEKVALKMLQDAMSCLAYGHALLDHVFIQEFAIATASRTETLNNISDLAMMAKMYEKQSEASINLGHANLNAAKAYINKTASASIFIEFYESDLYVATPTKQTIADRTLNDTSKGTFFLR